MERNKENRFAVRLGTGFFLLTGLVTLVSGYLKGWDIPHLISNTVLILLGTLIVLLLYALSREQGWFDYGNGERFSRFFVLWLLSLLGAVFCAWLPGAGWPVPVIYLGFTLFGNLPLGIISATVCLLLTVFLSGLGISSFVLYFLCGVLCAVLFCKTDKNGNITIPMVISLLCLFLALTAGDVLLSNERPGLELFAIPVLNVVVCAILMVMVIRIFFGTCLYRFRDKYQEMNDPAFSLQVQLKEFDKKKYYQAVHRAYFCERLSVLLNLNGEALKAAAYYRNIGILRGEENWENTKAVCEEYDFPKEVLDILQEIFGEGKKVISKEAAVLVFTDGVISGILYILEKQPDTKPDYDRIVEAVFRTKMKSGILAKSRLTLEEFFIMEKIFKEEKLYYDFLR